MSTKRFLTTAAVVIILGLLVYFQVQHWRSFDWARFRYASRVHPWHVAAAIALIYITYVLRALRWKIFLEPVSKARTASLIPPTFIGFAGLALLGRPGEFIRPYLIARREGLSFASQIGVWTVERIFDIGAFTVLMTLDVFLPSAVQANPYIHTFRVAALILCGLVFFASVAAVVLRVRGPRVAALLHSWSSRVSTKFARAVDQKVRAFGEGLNTIASAGSLFKLIVISLAMWFMIALAYREVAHAYPPEAALKAPPSVDVETAKDAGQPELAGEPLTSDTVENLRIALQQHGYDLRTLKGDIWLTLHGKPLKKVGDRPHLSNLDISHVLLLMGFSMVGSVMQLPAVGGGSQYAVITALRVIYGIPPEAALSCGILVWLVTFMSCIPVGLMFAHREHLSLRKLSKESHQQPDLAEGVIKSDQQ